MAGQTPAVGSRSHFHCDVRASFAATFRNWRHKTHTPLKRIAKDLGVSTSTVSAWELGDCFPTGYNFELLVEYTGLPPCKLFCIMAEKCVRAGCLLAMRGLTRNPLTTARQECLARPPRRTSNGAIPV